MTQPSRLLQQKKAVLQEFVTQPFVTAKEGCATGICNTTFCYSLEGCVTNSYNDNSVGTLHGTSLLL
ncbi:hypothetical protein [Okeania sp.]|uniref:hypothetical protein n=1 Tax=Okeania sp. TaxID=3100323 RepID=UPI002B4B11AC|nr:hypothetical protein [Okeania sp.]